ncbi:MAG TPA: DinB family protein, partial [Acidimicrobiia bacterium]
PLEYACHVRDVFALFDTRLHLMLDELDRLFANWDQDVTALEQRYAEQQPDRVALDLNSAALKIAASFDAVHDEQWSRRGRRSDGASFTVDSFARYFIHDPIHHLHDVG